MLIHTLQTALQSDRRVVTAQWESTRLLLKDDQMGFSFHITTIYEGAEISMWYQHHLEAVYCMSGTGEVEDLATETLHAIAPGTLYALDQHDRHILRAHTQMTLACVFTPPLHGKEIHNKDGSYPLHPDPTSP